MFSLNAFQFNVALFISTVPTSAPQNLNGMSATSTTISLSWNPPPLRDQNGIIREYRINITEVETGRTWQITSTTIVAMVQSLHPFYRYEWSVSAYTIGIGPYTAISVVTTVEDGMFVQITCSIRVLSNILSWGGGGGGGGP